MNATAAVLIGELVAAGVDVIGIMARAKEGGRVPDEVWDEIEAEVRRANVRWEAAGDL